MSFFIRVGCVTHCESFCVGYIQIRDQWHHINVDVHGHCRLSHRSHRERFRFAVIVGSGAVHLRVSTVVSGVFVVVGARERSRIDGDYEDDGPGWSSVFRCHVFVLFDIVYYCHCIGMLFELLNYILKFIFLILNFLFWFFLSFKGDWIGCNFRISLFYR